jgi:hypothetical protein
MARPADEARESYVKGIEAKAGRPIEELVAEVVAWGPGKHGELLKRAKEAFGLGHGHANLLVHLARDAAQGDAGASDEDPLDAIYAGSKAALRPLHEALLARLAQLGPFEVAPKKGYVSLRRAKQFAMVGPGSRKRLEVGVNLRGAQGGERFEALGPGKMCTHRAFVGEAHEIDDELLAFLKEAYEAAG